MNKAALINSYFQKKDQLTISSPFYQKLVSELFVWLLTSDQVDNDLTTRTLFETDKQVSARIITRQNITVAGMEEITFLLKKHTTLQQKEQAKDGDRLQPGNTLLTISGSLHELLAYERVILNMLQRMCGIATETTTIIEKIEHDNPRVAATRKTIWGLLDKKAVAVGGGLTHRLNLAGGILVKDNHLLALSPKEIIHKILQTNDETLIEIEVETEDHLTEFVNEFSTIDSPHALAILLDNFTPHETKKVLERISSHPRIIYEASGGITPENIDDWARTGVDVISLGALTHSSKAANLSLDLTI